MSAAPAEAAAEKKDQPAAAPQQDRGSKIKKLAMFLIMVGPDLASEILKSFDSMDIKELTTEMSRVSIIDFKTQQEVLGEFSQLAVQAATSVTGGTQMMKQILEKSLGAYQASEMLQNIAPSKQISVDATFLQDLDAKRLYNLLKSEDTQTVAFVLSYVDAVKCGQILGLFTPEARSEIITRIAMLEPIPSEVLSKVLMTIKSKVGSSTAPAVKSGGLQSVGDVIKNMDNESSRALLSALEQKDPELTSSLKKILFTFEDLKKLDQMSLQKVLREVESKDLALSLKTASEALQQSIFSALPKRAAEGIRDEIKFMGPVRLKDIEAAQDRIIEAMRKLEGQGEIDVSGGGKSDMV